MGCSVAAMLAASRLNRGYIATLEKSLLNRAVELDLADVEDSTSRTLMLRTLGVTRSDFGLRVPLQAETAARTTAIPQQPAALDPDLQAILAAPLARSRSGGRACCAPKRGSASVLVPHVIPLLAWDPVAADAVFALRKVAEERVGQLIDALIDPNQDFAVRRRLARVFSVCVSQRAADGLMLGLDDLRFEVRFQCGQSLAAAAREEPPGHDRQATASSPWSCGRWRSAGPVWESRRLLDELDVQDDVSFVDEFVRDRAGQSLAHVFTLLSLVLPREPLQIAFRSLYTDDQNLQGTALEYLEGVLPPPIRERLWPFLEDRRAGGASSARPRDEILADLLRSNQSIMLNLEELRRRAGVEPPQRAAPRRRISDEAGRMAEIQNKRIEPRAATPAPGDALKSTGRLPDDMLDEQVERLAAFTAVAAGLWALTFVIHAFVYPRRAWHRRPETGAGHRGVRGRRLSSLVFLYVRYAPHTCQTKTRRRPGLHGPQRDRDRDDQHLGDEPDAGRHWPSCRGRRSSS